MTEVGLALAAVLVALVVQRRALGDGLGPDDLVLLEFARGLRAWPEGPWRWLSGPLFWDAGVAMFGGHAASWHLVVWLLHGAAVAAVYVLARVMGAGRLVAFGAALWFGAHPALWDTLLPVSSVGEVMATLFVVVAMILLVRPAAAGWTAGAAIASVAAVLSKESVALVPIAACLVPRGERASAPMMRIVAIAAAGAGYLAWLLASGRAPAGPAYALAVGPNVFAHLAVYAGAATDYVHVAPDLWSPDAVVRGAVVLGVLVLGSAWAWRRTRVPAAGLAGFVLALGPVLLLRQNRQPHYLYTPIAFLSLSISSLASLSLDALARRVRGPSARSWMAWAATGIVALLAAHVGHAERAMAARGSRWIRQIDLPYDPLLRKMTLERNAVATLGPVLDADSSRLVVVQPPATGAFSVRTGDTTAAAPRYDLFKAVLDSGLAITAVEPQVREARIVSEWYPRFRDWWIATHYASGQLVILGRGDDAHAKLVERWTRWGYPRQARAYLETVLAGGDSSIALRRLAAALAAQDSS
jgi:hypothetical protein